MVNSCLNFGLTIGAAAFTAVGVYFWGKSSGEGEEVPSIDESRIYKEEAGLEMVIPSIEEIVKKEVDQDMTNPSTKKSEEKVGALIPSSDESGITDGKAEDEGKPKSRMSRLRGGLRSTLGIQKTVKKPKPVEEPEKMPETLKDPPKVEKKSLVRRMKSGVLKGLGIKTKTEKSPKEVVDCRQQVVFEKKCEERSWKPKESDIDEQVSEEIVSLELGVDEDMTNPSMEESGIHKEVDQVNDPLIGNPTEQEDMMMPSTEQSGNHKEDDAEIIPLIETVEQVVNQDEMIPSSRNESGSHKEDDVVIIPLIEESKDSIDNEEYPVSLENQTIEEDVPQFIPRLMMARDWIRPYAPPIHYDVHTSKQAATTYLLVTSLPPWVDPECLERLLKEVCGNPVESIEFCVKERGVFADSAKVTFRDDSLTGKEIPPTWMGMSQLSMTWIVDDLPVIEQPKYVTITNLPYKTTEQELREILFPDCLAKTIVIHPSDESGVLNCSATVSFYSSDEALKAEEILDGYVFHRRYIRVRK